MTVQNGRMLLIKSNQPKGEGPPTATGIEIRTGNGTEKESGKVGTPKGKSAKAWDLEGEPASTGNRTRKSLIESKT
ncbi:hypothetical protein, partial [Streptomyces sp. NPDC014741]|uniref:hypothetical protein n=1 Tax=Streptomyces sp. NPDC014741 TaxID=3364902 RepID=UPI0036F7157A